MRKSHCYYKVITSVKTHKPLVALTFDDGPNPEYTPILLDILERHSAKATFFVVGKRAKRYPEILERMALSGHAIGNHSWDHESLPMIDSKSRRLQIRKCRSILGENDSGLLRPPFGHLDLRTRIDIFLAGCKIIGWSVEVEDWLDHPVDTIFRKLKKRIKPGSIVLLHDNLFYALNTLYQCRSASLQAVERLLSEEKEFEYVTVLELLKSGTAVCKPFKIPIDPVWLRKLVCIP